MNNQFTLKIPCKIILSGEHSCVYNQPLIVATLPLYQTTNFQFTKSTDVSIDFQTCLDFSEIELQTLKNICLQVVDYLGIQKKQQNYDFLFKFQTDAPLRMGLGSSAQFILSIFECFKKFAQNQGIKINTQNNFEFLRSLEDNFHGKSSGLDILALQQNLGIHYIIKKDNQYIVQQIHNVQNLKILLVSSGIHKHTTKAVNKVKEFLQKSDKYTQYIYQIGKCTKNLSKLLQHSEIEQQEVNAQIQENQKLLQKFKISHEKIDEIVEKLKKFELESKLSGGGLGGFVIAIMTNSQFEKIHKNLIYFLNEQKSQYFIFDINKNLINRIH